jgi:hypothetical protein
MERGPRVRRGAREGRERGSMDGRQKEAEREERGGGKLWQM